MGSTDKAFYSLCFEAGNGCCGLMMTRDGVTVHVATFISRPATFKCDDGLYDERNDGVDLAKRVCALMNEKENGNG